MRPRDIQRLKRTDPDFAPRVILDVGANAGDVSLRLSESFPEARIHAFEPAPETFDKLSARIADAPTVQAHRLALGARAGSARFTRGRNRNNRLLGPGEEAKGAVTVETSTGDAFCREAGIDQIDLLKIDAEGHDLEVLVGFSGMLAAGAVGYIQVETTTNLDNRFHVHLERFIHFLHPFNYRVTELYEYHRKIYATNQPMRGAWFCNALFTREVEGPQLRRDGRN